MQDALPSQRCRVFLNVQRQPATRSGPIASLDGGAFTTGVSK